MDTLVDVSGDVKGLGEGDRELELNSSMTIVDEGGLNLVGVAADEARRWKADRDPESTALVTSSEELDESLIVKDEENQFSGFS